MQAKQTLVAAVIAAITLMLAEASAQDAASAAGRAILAAHEGAVVTVRLVITQQISRGGQSESQELTEEAVGTIIHPSGLTVLSLSQTDPSSVLATMGLPSGLTFESEVDDVRIMLSDGKELAAEFVLRDMDLDLAYVRPKEASEPLEFVDMAESTDPQILDQVVIVSRLGKVANRTGAAAFEHVQAVVERPRKFFITGRSGGQQTLGAPVFNVSGAPVGLMVLRTIKSTGGGGGMMGMMRGNQANVLPIVLPGKEIAQHIEQALEQRVPAEADAPAPTEEPAAEPAPDAAAEQTPDAAAP